MKKKLKKIGIDDGIPSQDAVYSKFQTSSEDVGNRLKIVPRSMPCLENFKKFQKIQKIRKFKKNKTFSH